MFFIALLLLAKSAAQTDPVQDLVRLEERLTDALVRLDVRTIDGLWSDDLIFVGTDGKSTTKAERLSRMKGNTGSSASVSSAMNDEIKVRLYGQAAVVTLLSTWRTRANNREISDRYMTTHLWAKQRGQWRLVSAHVTRLAT